MTLKGNQRAGAKQLAMHLLRTDDNDHVEVHDIRGFIAADLTGALREAYAISRATKCRQIRFTGSRRGAAGAWKCGGNPSICSTLKTQ